MGMEKIKKFRKRKGWSQEKLAKESGISRVTISLLETGKQSITTNATIKRIAGALEISADDFF